jgi:spermidine/putrescine transport system permease protein
MGALASRRTLFSVMALPAIWLCVFYLAPMIVALLYSLWHSEHARIVRTLTLDNYREVFTSAPAIKVLLGTAQVSLVTALFALLIAYPAAYFLAKKVHRYQQVLVVLAITPLWTSHLIRTLAWYPMLSSTGVINSALMGLGIIGEPISGLLFSHFAVTVALVAIYVPYMILALYAVLEKLDDRLLEASADLGATKWQTFRNIVLPLSTPGAAAGLVLVFGFSMGSYVTPAILGGSSGVMIGNMIAGQFMVAADYSMGSALALVVTALILSLSGFALRRGRVGDLYR